MPRYVILRHEVPPGHAVAGGRGTHWDLLLERGEILQTWALADEPAAEVRTTAERLADHRLAYLEYEGPVTGNRGHVTRRESGEYQIVAETGDRLALRLASQAGVRYLLLAADQTGGDHCWIASFSLAPIRGESGPGSTGSSSS